MEDYPDFEKSCGYGDVTGIFGGKLPVMHPENIFREIFQILLTIRPNRL